MNERKIIVEFTIHIDHPELRDSSFKPSVPRKTSIQWYPETRKGAINIVNSILAGEEDFSSEYVSRVQAFYSNGSRRTIHKMQHRDSRDSEWIVGG